MKLAFFSNLFNELQMIKKIKQSIDNAWRKRSIRANKVVLPNGEKNVFFDVSIGNKCIGQIQFKVKEIFS
jgi:hypothetical protein